MSIRGINESIDLGGNQHVVRSGKSPRAAEVERNLREAAERVRARDAAETSANAAVDASTGNPVVVPESAKTGPAASAAMPTAIPASQIVSDEATTERGPMDASLVDQGGRQVLGKMGMMPGQAEGGQAETSVLEPAMTEQAAPVIGDGIPGTDVAAEAAVSTNELGQAPEAAIPGAPEVVPDDIDQLLTPRDTSPAMPASADTIVPLVPEVPNPPSPQEGVAESQGTPPSGGDFYVDDEGEVHDTYDDGGYSEYREYETNPEDVPPYGYQDDRHEDEEGPTVGVPDGHPELDMIFNYGVDTTDVDKEDRERYVRNYNTSGRRSGAIDEAIGNMGVNIEEGEALDFAQDDSDTKTKTKAIRAALATIRMVFNPAKLRIQHDMVVTETRVINGEKRKFTHIEHSDRVTAALQAVRDVFGGISEFDAMVLVICRAGIGMAFNNMIGNQKADEFELYEDNLVAICDDICQSMEGVNLTHTDRANTMANPFLFVRGTRYQNLRDEESGYLKAIGTIAMPMPIVPTSILTRLCEAKNSPWSGMDPHAIQIAMLNDWLNYTYPEAVRLCANAEHGAKQLFSWVNMARAIIAAEGLNPKNFGLTTWNELEDRLSVDTMWGLAQATGDKDIITASDFMRQKAKVAYKRMMARFRTEGGTRRRNKLGDAVEGVTAAQMGAKAMSIPIILSTPVEELVIRVEQHLALKYEKRFTDKVDPDGVFSYDHRFDQMVDDVRTQNALDVAERLWRIAGGGWSLIDAYIDTGRPMTIGNLKEFLVELGVTDESAGSLLEKLGIKPDMESAFVANIRHILDPDTRMAGIGLFSKTNARQFFQISCVEMARMNNIGVKEMTLTSDQMLEIGSGRRGGEETVSALLRTAGGREAFLTLGNNSLARKSPLSHGVQVLLNKNRFVTGVIRQVFARFIEYDLQRIVRQVPLSHSLSYVISYMLNKTWGEVDAEGVENVFRRQWAYQMGSNYNDSKLWGEGLRKCLRYDALMAGNKLAMSILWCAFMMCSGIEPPDEDENLHLMSEWKIGKGETALPMKWAWWMDDLTGVSIPFGTALAVMLSDAGQSDGFASVDRMIANIPLATAILVNGVGSWNRTSVLYDFMEFVASFDTQCDQLLDPAVGEYYNPTAGERALAISEGLVFDILGDLTPTIIEQLCPWSRDNIFRTSEDISHTASRTYDITFDDANTDWVSSYNEYMRRRRSQTNLLEALFWNAVTPGAAGTDHTGYLYTQQPLATQVDPRSMAIYNRFYLDLYNDPEIPMYNQISRENILRKRAQEVDDYIREHYDNPQQAALDGFCLNYDARVNCIWHCYAEMDRIYSDYDAILDMHYYDSSTYRAIMAMRDAELAEYEDLLYNYYKGDDIPWSQPRYYVLESDTAYRWVDDEGNPSFPLIGNEEPYRYGGRTTGLVPFTQPNTRHQTGFNYETLPWYIKLDDDGNPVNDVEAMYDDAGTLPAISMGKHAGQDVRELMWGGQGTNMKDNVSEELRIPRGGIPTTGDRNIVPVEDTLPEVSKIDGQVAADILGVNYAGSDGSTTPDPITGGTTSADQADFDDDGYYGAWGGEFIELDPDKVSSADLNDPLTRVLPNGKVMVFVPKEPTTGKSSGSGYRYRGGGYYRRYGYGGTTNYAPKIYSSSKQVYSDKAAGLNTRQPYKATTPYLRPEFSTKGSREAYGRSDF